MPSDAIYVCAYTNKQFKSQAAYDNYLKSKKYKQLVAQAAKAEIVTSSRLRAYTKVSCGDIVGGSVDFGDPVWLDTKKVLGSKRCWLHCIMLDPLTQNDAGALGLQSAETSDVDVEPSISEMT